MNFYVAGMRANSTYLMNWETITPAGAPLVTGAQIAFQTGAIPASIPISPFTLVVPAPEDDRDQPVLLQSFLSRSVPFYANALLDLQGNVLWYYYSPDSFILRPQGTGNIMVLQRGAIASDAALPRDRPRRQHPR